jgi:hypothetical protein
LTAAYLPNALFFVPGTDQYFTQWSMSYLQENFYADTWLIADELGEARIETVAPGREGNPLPAGQQLIGAILTRKLTSPP